MSKKNSSWFLLCAPVALALAISPIACEDEGDDGGNEGSADVDGDGDGQDSDEGPGNTDDTDPGGDGDTDADADADSEDKGLLSCGELKEGKNQRFDVDGKPRTLILNLPQEAEAEGPWPVIFNWHGFGDTADNMATFLSDLVNDEEYPFIAVTPEDKNLMPPGGFDWAFLQVGKNNVEGKMFDAVLACLDERFGVDPDRIHLMGLSAGAIAADLVGVLRGEQVASILTYSGAYFSNPLNLEKSILNSMVYWPELPEAADYTQAVIYGGPTDTYNLVVETVSFYNFALNDVTYLNENGHDVLLCDHNGGHPVIPGEIWAPQALDFFADHPKSSGGSPYGETLPSWVPDYCEFKAGL